MNFPDAVLYQRRADIEQVPPRPVAPAPAEISALARELPAPWMPASRSAVPGEQPVILPPVVEAATNRAPTEFSAAAAHYAAGRYSEATDILLNALASSQPPAQAEVFSLLARSLANQGRLRDAVSWCERWITADKLNPIAHYLQAMVSQELGEHGAARRSLQQVLYLEPKFVLAHFALGNLARAADGQGAEANKHFANALRLLRAHPPDELLPESDGLTAGRLQEIIGALMTLSQPHGAAA